MQKKEIRAKQANECFYCERFFLLKELTRDHFFPVAEVGNGQEGAKGNIVLACDPCNNKKGARLPKQHEIVKFVIIFGKLPYHLKVYYDNRKSTRKTKLR